MVPGGLNGHPPSTPCQGTESSGDPRADRCGAGVGNAAWPEGPRPQQGAKVGFMVLAVNWPYISSGWAVLDHCGWISDATHGSAACGDGDVGLDRIIPRLTGHHLPRLSQAFLPSVGGLTHSLICAYSC